MFLPVAFWWRKSVQSIRIAGKKNVEHGEGGAMLIVSKIHNTKRLSPAKRYSKRARTVHKAI
jgi:hypothetical protein